MLGMDPQRLDAMAAQLASRSCRRCGCTDHRPCIDQHGQPCWWVEHDLCSHCTRFVSDPEQRQARALERVAQVVEDLEQRLATPQDVVVRSTSRSVSGHKMLWFALGLVLLLAVVLGALDADPSPWTCTAARVGAVAYDPERGLVSCTGDGWAPVSPPATRLEVAP